MEVFSCLSSHFPSCNTLTVLLFYVKMCSMCSHTGIATQVEHASHEIQIFLERFILDLATQTSYCCF